MCKKEYIVKILLILSVLSSILLADDVTLIQFSGVETTYKDKEMSVKRVRDPKCKKVGITPHNLFGGNLAARAIPRECKRSIVTSSGATQPMKIDSEIETVGELEILKFLEILEFEPEKYALIDARKPHWYKEMTIPNSINIPYSDLKEDEDFSEEYARALKLLNIKKDKNEKLDFSLAKEVILFCNANWCAQSVWAIKTLVKMGYPKNKIFWYRGGLQDWAGSGFTTVKP